MNRNISLSYAMNERLAKEFNASELIESLLWEFYKKHDPELKQAEEIRAAEIIAEKEKADKKRVEKIQNVIKLALELFGKTLTETQAIDYIENNKYGDLKVFCDGIA